MRRPLRYEHSRTSPNFDFILTHPQAQGSFKDIPGLIIMVMEMQRGNQPQRLRRSTRISPLRNHKRIAARTENLAG
jgi:hypothetical protein